MPSPTAIPHVDAALAKSARERFQQRYAEPLTDEDGREIATTLLGSTSAPVEIRFLPETDEGQELIRYDVLPTDLSRAFVYSRRIAAALPTSSRTRGRRSSTPSRVS